jgi:hypothetical protein
MNPLVEICDLPTPWWGNAKPGEEADGVAVGHLMSCLGQIRGVQYDLLDRPDHIDRNRSACDYRYSQPATGETVAVEFKRFVQPEMVEAMSLRRKGKRFGQRGRMRPLEHAGEQYGVMSKEFDPGDEVGELRGFIVKAVLRGQLQAVEADERLLLVLDTRLVYMDYATASNFSFNATERNAVDHAFLLRPGSRGTEDRPSKILQVW